MVIAMDKFGGWWGGNRLMFGNAKNTDHNTAYSTSMQVPTRIADWAIGGDADADDFVGADDGGGVWDDDDLICDNADDENDEGCDLSHQDHHAFSYANARADVDAYANGST